MGIFNPVDVMGPTHRGAVVQQVAQNAAQNVLRKQRMQALLQQSAANAAGHQQGQRPIGGSVPFRGSAMPRPMGARPNVSRAQQVANLIQPGGGMESTLINDPTQNAPVEFGSLPGGDPNTPGVDPTQWGGSSADVPPPASPGGGGYQSPAVPASPADVAGGMGLNTYNAGGSTLVGQDAKVYGAVPQGGGNYVNPLTQMLLRASMGAQGRTIAFG